MIGSVAEQLAANREQLATLGPARLAPRLLDDATVNRIKEVFGVQRDDMWLWQETGRRWQAETLTPQQRTLVDRYEALVTEFAASNAEILALADELAAGTIETVMAKSDLELGIEAVLRGLGPR
ncbi:hypothetical protein Acor_75410 [Acrocarpospora corrugata]|uniref:Uncharacterized protein n=1 Tax=Acrocarpospora corrugata TaxID=35763 RepID=A0A5M3WED5_9ACTN|nr:hypothetical protein [Acrocarpospora corrugata]GES05473.1 hypothetical protein Acor_75410 [Acrocarpospora corrugata]